MSTRAWQVEPVEAAEIPAADAESVARTILLRELTGQARSRFELAERLRKKNVPQEIADELLVRFEEVGLIDDSAFAREWIASRQPSRGLARRALAVELRRKGIDDEVAHEALSVIEPEVEDETARMMVRLRLRRMTGLPREVQIRRLVAMLARKGYGPGMSLSIVKSEIGFSDETYEGRNAHMPQSCA